MFCPGGQIDLIPSNLVEKIPQTGDTGSFDRCDDTKENFYFFAVEVPWKSGGSAVEVLWKCSGSAIEVPLKGR